MKTLKKCSIAIAAVILLVLGVYIVMQEKEIEYVAPVQTEVATQEELDNISEAQKQLNEAKRLLQVEEEKLLAEIAEREVRLEEIREVRLSFSQAPTPVE